MSQDPQGMHETSGSKYQNLSIYGFYLSIHTYDKVKFINQAPYEINNNNYK